MKKLITAIMLGTLASFAQNIVKDGDFGTDTTKLTPISANWKLTKNKANWEACNIDGISSGTCATLKFDDLPTTGKHTGTLSQVLKCKPDTEYTVKAQLKGNGCKTIVTVLASSGKSLAEISSVSKNWEAKEAKFTTGKNASEISIVVSCDTTAKKGQASVDDIMVFTGKEPAKTVKKVPAFVPKGENIALNRPYTFSIRPNYSLCTDPDDMKQLTDGKFTSGYFWGQKSTVGWGTGNVLNITLDLGSVQPISGFSYSTAFGKAGVTPPEFINLYVSDDAKTWYFVGELLEKSFDERGKPSFDEYTLYTAGSNDMPCKGRYVSFLLKQNPYTFVDEIQILKGDDSLLGKPASEISTASPMIHFSDTLIQKLIRNGLDELTVRSKKLKGNKKAEFLDAIKDYRKNGLKTVSVGDIEQAVPIFPLCEGHKAFFALNAKYFQAKGITKPFIWRNCRWDNMDPLAEPPEEKLADVDIEMMRGEVRAETINILNPTDKTLVFKVAVEGLPEGSGIDCREVLGMLTNQVKYSTSALKPGDGASINVEICPGMSKQVWLSFKRPTLKAGNYKATVTATAEDVKLSVPLKLTIYDFDFPAKPRLHVGGWDYLHGDGNFYGGKNCIEANIAMMRSIYTDSPWASGGVMPGGAKFDAEGNLTNPDELKFDAWNAWVKRWNNATLYCVFANHGTKFNGEPMGTPRFNNMVTQYYKAWAEYLKKTEIQPENIVVLIADEPYDKATDNIIINYAKPIRAAKTGFAIFEDPIWERPEMGTPEMYESSDILCPNTISMTNYDDVDAFEKFFLDYQAKGAKLWLYSCSGPARLLDPLTYHRGQEWRAFKLGAEGSFYWALGCGGGIGDSWHVFKQVGKEYSPFMVDPNKGPMDAKQSEGIREGVQDYEYLCMLRDRIAELKKAGKNSKKVAEAEKILKMAPSRALRLTPVPGAEKWSQKNGMMWSDEKDRTHMDAESRKVLRALNSLK